ncbi:I78 family peptidase inhibitor [uncultured Sphingomonas sp.]|uniref:I78 family peptidase inhibitor n=1 Tax=uncultured Sphingomonas sp. TaxID=158754 RepID=UPI0025EFF8D9|nr:I78 family peptidase inhibitor [uncultured Sphingomonas sp.]
MMRAALLIAAVTVTACAPKNAEVAASSAETCNAEAVQRFLGQPADTAQAESQRLSGARTVRRYATGDMLTMDYRVDRLNIEIDAGGRIVKLTCG